MTDHQFGQNQNTAFERCQTPETGHLKPFITVKLALTEFRELNNEE